MTSSSDVKWRLFWLWRSSFSSFLSLVCKWFVVLWRRLLAGSLLAWSLPVPPKLNLLLKVKLNLLKPRRCWRLSPRRDSPWGIVCLFVSFLEVCKCVFLSRLYTKAVHLGFQRSKRNQNPNVSLLKLEGVKDVDAAHYYLGKRVAFIYRATKRAGTKHRVMWGKITRTHGNSGAVRANFRHNLPPKSIGATLRVMMFPSRV